jgi:DNA repair photolyase
LLRLPRGVRTLFEQWLADHRPGEASKVLGRLAQVRGGRSCDGGFGTRMSGDGPMAEVVGQLFENARRRAGLAAGPPPLSSASFRRPARECPLFDGQGGEDPSSGNGQA